MRIDEYILAMTYAVLGGGISGLTAAYYLKSFGVTSKILLIEGSNHLGGWINSYRNKNGTLFEIGPRTLRVAGNAGANTLLLAELLKLEDQIIPVCYDHPAAKNRMIKVDNKLHKLPNSLKSICSKLPPFSKPLALYLLKDLITPSVYSNDESFFSFAQRRFGIEIAKYAVDPFCRGVFAGNAKELSVMALSKRIYEVEQKYNSVIKGFIFDRKNSPKKDPLLKCSLIDRAKKEKWSVWSLNGGLRTLVEAVKSQLQNSDVEFITQTNILEVKMEGSKVVIITEKGNYSVDKTISCLPAVKLKNIVNKWNPDLYSLLNDIPYVSVGIVNLEYSADIIKEPAFGYLIPSSESSKALGVIYDSCIFPQEGKTVLTVMMGGYWFKEIFGNDPSPEEILNVALHEIKSTFSLDMKPSCYKVSILRDCIPQYTVGHFERVENARELLQGSNLYLAGNSFDGVGVNDAIYATKQVVMSSLNA